MSENMMIIITGAPATGKTALSKNLAERFNLPVINKDEIKFKIYSGVLQGEIRIINIIGDIWRKKYGE